MEETLAFIDEGFLDKLTKLFGDGKRIKYDKFAFAKRISKNQVRYRSRQSLWS